MITDRRLETGVASPNCPLDNNTISFSARRDPDHYHRQKGGDIIGNTADIFSENKLSLGRYNP